MKKAFGCIGIGLGVLVGSFVLLIVAGIVMGPSPNRVSQECRRSVALAAANVDAWRYIHHHCTIREEDVLIREFNERGLSTEHIDRSRKALAEQAAKEVPQ